MGDEAPLPLPPLSPSSPSPSVTLRKFDLSDLDDLMTWVTDERVSRDTSWYTCETRDDVLRFLEDTIIPAPFYRAVCMGSGRAVGFLFAKPGAGIGRRRAELGYSLAREHWGRGVATAAVRAAIPELLAEWPHLERLEALVLVENVASQRVLEKAGFQREGVLRRYYNMKGKVWDMVMYSFLPPLQP